MTILGKKDVQVEVFTNDVLTKAYVDNRVVYRLADGRFQVSWFGGGKREIEQREDGSFYWRIDVKSLKTKLTPPDVIAGLLGKVP